MDSTVPMAPSASVSGAGSAIVGRSTCIAKRDVHVYAIAEHAPQREASD